MPIQHRPALGKLARILAVDSELTIPEKCALLQSLRGDDQESAQLVDQRLLRAYSRLQTEFQSLGEALKEQQSEIRSLTEPPLYPAILLKLLDGGRAIVSQNGSARVVTCNRDLDRSQLGIGDAVLLNAELNVLLEPAPYLPVNVGDTAEFVRTLDAGRIVLRSREERIVVRPANNLAGMELQEGDQVRFDRNTRIAYEKIDNHVSTNYLVDDLPQAEFAQVGGNRRPLEKLKKLLKRICCSAEIADKYQLGRQQSILLHGPPGCGKTLMIRVVASALARSMDQKFRLAIVKPAAWESPYVGVTQSRIRECFESLRSEADKGMVLLYLDEIEAVGRIRGGTISHHNDKFLAALLAEIDGFAARGNVAIVASTNRKDLLDPALLERLSDLELPVPRPTSSDAREIIDIHLPRSLPFSPNGPSAETTRIDLIEHTVSRLYAPNAGTALNQIKFRDGSTRRVGSRELISGRMIEQICRATRQIACDREIDDGPAGVARDDLDMAIDDALERMASTLSLQNARTYLPDLPRDIDIVDVTRTNRNSVMANQFVSDYGEV